MQRTPQERLVPPHDPEAERALLGCILLNPRVLDDLDGLRPGHFYWEQHAKLFGHLLAIHEARKPLDTKLLVENLRQHGDLEAVGGGTWPTARSGGGRTRSSSCSTFSAQTIPFTR
jgi:replicative DNA helicase